ncbi:hypothetical protein E1295_37820 [Nonomuraea mesophila]|uniref:Uncharacterized protein n=1 Tax=Nonomuraea mesophila TaxID=2530382 RepID=A0A4R5EHC8_9ACTN|nr:hypothetical protein [Nonomuraea mesophila]TDE33692.1 hypothetical protein E1295_37820 [Nonomuraea mesophila]
MRRTNFYTRPEILAAADDIAHSYPTARETGARFDFTTSERAPFVGLPAGGSYSPPGELLRFVTALREDGRLLDHATVELATSGKSVRRCPDGG